MTEKQIPLKEMKQIISIIKKVFKPSDLKIDLNECYGSVNFILKTQKVQIQRNYQGLKDSFKEDGFKVDYKGSSFTVYYEDPIVAENRELSELRKEGERLLSLLK